MHIQQEYKKHRRSPELKIDESNFINQIKLVSPNSDDNKLGPKKSVNKKITMKRPIHDEFCENETKNIRSLKELGAMISDKAHSSFGRNADKYFSITNIGDHKPISPNNSMGLSNKILPKSTSTLGSYKCLITTEPQKSNANSLSKYRFICASIAHKNTL